MTNSGLVRYPFLREMARQMEKPRVFVSYHHGNDQGHFDAFVRLFSETYSAVTDRSLDRVIDSDDCDYVYQRIRSEFITGTSCTVVLCGAETQNRKYVDWEIKATLDKGHGLLAVSLPTRRTLWQGVSALPDRLQDNLMTGYAHHIPWTANGIAMVRAIDEARERARRVSLIDNSRTMMRRNR